MSDTKSNNIRLECPFCKETFLNKSFSKHLNDDHFNEIFNDEKNKKELEELSTKKNTVCYRPVEVIVKEKELYYVPCCKKYYSKITQAKKHGRNKECFTKVISEVKKDLESIVPITINNNIDISGNNNTVNNTVINNITQNITFVDLSGNVLKTIKRLVSEIDDKESERAYTHKKLEKLRAKYKNDEDYDSDISSVESYYGDDESDDYKSKVERFIPEDVLDSKYLKTLAKMGIECSREKLGLRCKDDHEQDMKEKEERIRFQKEQEQEEKSERIGNLRADIKCLYDKIKHLQKVHNEYLELMKNENSGITEEIFEAQFSQTSKINKLQSELSLVKSKLSKLL